MLVQFNTVIYYYFHSLSEQWDEYFDQVKVLLARLPCMVNPGNHETDSLNSAE